MALQTSVGGKQNFLPTLPAPTSTAKRCAWVKWPDGTKDNCRGVWAPSECSTTAYLSVNNATAHCRLSLPGCRKRGHATASWYRRSPQLFHGISTGYPSLGIVRIKQCYLHVNEQTSDPTPFLVLTAKFLAPPGMHSAPSSLARSSIGFQGIAQWSRLIRYQTEVIDTVTYGTLGVQQLVTLSEWTLGISKDPTFFFVLNLLGHKGVQFRTVTRFSCSTPRYCLFLPAVPKFQYAGSLAAILQSQVIIWFPIEVTTEPTHSISVAAGHLGSHVSIPVVGNGQAKVCAQDSITALAVHLNLPTCSLKGQVLKDAIHLGRDAGRTGQGFPGFNQLAPPPPRLDSTSGLHNGCSLCLPRHPSPLTLETRTQISDCLFLKPTLPVSLEPI